MNINYFKKRLEEEEAHLEKVLSRMARQNPQNPKDWEAKPEDLNIMTADKTELSDSIEEFGNLSAIENTVEERYNDIKKALQKIKDGKYGICRIENCKIERDRLKADPTATTCIKHADHID